MQEQKHHYNGVGKLLNSHEKPSRSALLKDSNSDVLDRNALITVTSANVLNNMVYRASSRPFPGGLPEFYHSPCPWKKAQQPYYVWRHQVCKGVLNLVKLGNAQDVNAVEACPVATR